MACLCSIYVTVKCDDISELTHLHSELKKRIRNYDANHFNLYLKNNHYIYNVQIELSSKQLNFTGYIHSDFNEEEIISVFSVIKGISNFQSLSIEYEELGTMQYGFFKITNTQNSVKCMSQDLILASESAY